MTKLLSRRISTALLTKATATLVCALFIFQPLAAVFAQSTAESSASSVVELPTQAAEQAKSQAETPAPSNELPDQAQAVTPEPNEHSNAPGQKPDSEEKKDKPRDTETPEDQVSALAGPANGQLSAQKTSESAKLAKVDLSSGALTYSYPLITPPGRNGIEPNLSLDYNSQTTIDPKTQTNSMWFGSGWTLNLPYIERLNKYGVEKLYSGPNFAFISSLSGELVSTGASTFVAKTENGEFLEYALTSGVWTVKDKNGVTYTFGATPNSTIKDPGAGTQVFRWMLTEIRDASGNYTTYAYSGGVMPDFITYTHNGAVSGVFEVDFIQGTQTLTPYGLFHTGFNTTSPAPITAVNIKVSGSIVKTYSFAYETPAVYDYTLRLVSITESAGGVNMPSTIFNYASAGTKSFSHPSSGWTLPSGLHWLIDYPIQLADFNGDSLPDLFGPYWTGTYYQYSFFMNTGSGWEQTPNTTWNLPSGVTLAQTAGGGGAKLADVNSDNLVDILVSQGSLQGLTTTPENKIYKNKGTGDAVTGWELVSNIIPTNVFFKNYLGYNSGTQSHEYDSGGALLLDVNGDGLSDIVQSYVVPPNGCTICIEKVFINTGGAWDTAAVWPQPEFLNNPIPVVSAPDFQFVDLNGDRIPDSFYRGEVVSSGLYDNNIPYGNIGNGWSYGAGGLEIEDLVFLAGGFQFGEVNGDGFQDIISAHNELGINDGLCSGAPTNYRFVFMNLGGISTSSPFSNWEQDSNWSLPTDNKFSLYTVCQAQGANPSPAHPMVVDVNADGLSDFVDIESPDGVFLNNYKPRLLSSITLPTGAVTDIKYKQASEYKNGSTLLNPKLPIPVTTVEELKTTENAGANVLSKTNYVYKDGYYYFGGPFDRKFAGFGTIIETDFYGNKTNTYFHQGTGSIDNASQGEYQDNFFKIGKPYKVEQGDGTNVLRASINKWDSFDLGSGRGFAKLIETVNMQFASGSHFDTVETSTFDNANGNLLTKVQLGQVSVSNTSNGTYADTGSDKLTTTYTYTNNASPRLLLPATQVTTNQSGTKINETKFYYDTLALGQANKGSYRILLDLGI